MRAGAIGGETAAGRLATAVLAAFAIATGAGRAIAPPPALVLALAAGGGLAMVGGLPAPLRRVTPALLVAVTAGLLRGSLSAQPPGGSVAGSIGSGPVVMTGSVRESVSPGPAGGLVVDVSHLLTAGGEADVGGSVLVPQRPGASRDAGPGDPVRIDASNLRTPGRRPGPRSESALERTGVDAIAASATVTRLGGGGPNLSRSLQTVRDRLAAAVEAVLPEPGATLVLGIAFGIRRPLDQSVTQDLQDAGLFHIVVVSGLKVIIVAGMIRAVSTARGWSRRRYALIAVLTVGGYVLLSGAGPAAVRSAAMAGMALLLRLPGRRLDPSPVLALTAAVMLGIEPGLCADVGFQLSFLGTAGILLLADPIRRRLPGPAALAEPFAVTVAAELITFPVMAGTFGVISLVGPLANALVLPLLPALIVLGFSGAGAAIVLPWLGWLPLQLAGAVADAAVVVAHQAAALPGAAIHVGTWPRAWTWAELTGAAVSAAVMLGLHLARPREAAPSGWPRSLSWRCCAAVACGVVVASAVLAVAGRPDGRLHLTVLDVGAGSAVLVRTGDGHLALVGGGADPQRLLTALGRTLPPTTHVIDLVVATATDRASLAGLSGLPGHYQVDSVATAGPPGPAARALIDQLGARARSRLDGAVPWRWAGVTWRCLDIPAAQRRSCPLRVTAPDAGALVLGSTPPADQDEVAGMYGDACAADLLVAPPGGAVTAALLAAVRPGELAAPSPPGARSAAGPPGVAISRTGVDGDLDYVSERDGLRRERGG